MSFIQFHVNGYAPGDLEISLPVTTDPVLPNADAMPDDVDVLIVGCDTASPWTDRTTSVHFYDSVVVFEVGAADNGNKTTGHAERFDGRWAPDGVNPDRFAQLVDQTLKDIEKEGPEWETGYMTDDRDAHIRELRA